MKKLIFIATAIMVMAGCNCRTKYPAFIANHDTAVVPTTAGQVGGYFEDGVYIFKGLPYATSQRFMPPTPTEKWEGVRTCFYYGPQAPQTLRSGWKNDTEAFVYHWDDGTQDEVCQYLNIWTDGIKDNGKRPVMVWLHGGGFAMGASSELPMYDGANLAKKGVVLVSINHRLNSLGYLDLSSFGEKYKYSGNLGTLDQIEALKWVKENIAAFGGDPNNVTIFGQSGGGGKVNILLDSPMAKGLFHKAIVQSGSMMGIEDQATARAFGEEVVRQLGLTAETIDKINEVSYADIMDATARAQRVVEGGATPVLDGEVIKYPLFDVRVGEISGNVPVIVGHNVTENVQFVALAKFVKSMSMMPGESLREQCVNQLTAKYEMGGAPGYLFLFGKKSPVLDGQEAAGHCQELSYVFDNIYLGRHMTGAEPSAYKLASKMSDMWVAFARTGNPSIRKYKWESFNPQTEPTMYFDDNLRMISKDDAVIKTMFEDPRK